MNLQQLQQALAAYDFQRELGGGGMSRVFLATERALGRRVVVKLLSEELASGVSAERFKREIQVVAQLQHPNIVPLLSAGEVGGLPYYTMPFVEGESLRSRLSRSGELSVSEALRILRDIARALFYAHQHAVIHRDIKPDNVLLSGDYAVVTDFGVGKALSAARTDSAGTLTQFGVAVGTPAYMAPEQAAGDNVDHRADIYAFGCLAYEVLSGAPPFTGSAQVLLAAHINSNATPLRAKRASVPDALADLVTYCLAKRPADRPQSAQELVQALEAIATPATGTGVGTGFGRAPRRRRTRLAWLLAIVMSCAAIGTAMWSRRSAPAAVNQSLVAVLPFRVSAADPALRYLREGMMDLVAAKLTGSFRAVDPRTVLTAWRREGGSENVDLPEREGVGVARSLQSARLLHGEIVGSAGELAISGTLIDVESGNPRARVRVQGVATSLAVLVDSLVAKLLVLESGGDEQQAILLAGTPFPALQAYLAGQRFYRGGKYVQAGHEFARAIDIDSTFALAALHVGLAAGWTLDPRRCARARSRASLSSQAWRSRPMASSGLPDLGSSQNVPRTPC